MPKRDKVPTPRIDAVTKLFDLNQRTRWSALVRITRHTADATARGVHAELKMYVITMNEGIANFADVDEDVLAYEVSDQDVEATAGLLEGQTKSVTLAFCSGLDTCPS